MVSFWIISQGAMTFMHFLAMRQVLRNSPLGVVLGVWPHAVCTNQRCSDVTFQVHRYICGLHDENPHIVLDVLLK